jgi:DNA-binding NarL/FixJ family response regulator
VDDLERLAVAAYLTGRDEASSDLWLRAHNEHARANDATRAARCAFWLALDLFNRGEWAAGNGWVGRGLRLLDEPEVECAERGLLLVLSVRERMKSGDLAGARAAATRVAGIASRFADPELNVFSGLATALIRMTTGDFQQTAAMFDEIMVAVTVDEVSPIGVGVVYCAVIEACYYVFDVGRAREWTNALSRWCSAQPDLVPFRGKCLVHRAEIMRLSGAWTEARLEAEQVCRWSDAKTSSFTYPVGAAYYELAEIHRLRGEFMAADTAYRRASEFGRAPQPGLMLLHLRQGHLDAAETTARRLLAERQQGLARAAVLSAGVEVLIAVGDVATARTAAEELAQLTTRHDASVLRALAAHALGAIHLANGSVHEAIAALRAAWMTWQELEAPYEAARVRVLLGTACQQLGDAATAELEFDTANRVFERLAAAPDVARVQELRGAPRKGGGILTHRELQVIALIAQGKTNRAIAQQLSISERTVDRHVSNILLKLELPSRSAATAYAYEHGLL